MERSIKQEFVRKVLQEQAQKLDLNQTRRIKNYLNFRTGALLEDRNVTIQAGDSSMDGQLTLRIPIYGRFLDMRRKNVKNARLRKNTSIKAYPIYNSPTMSTYNAIGKRLMYFLTDEVANQIKKELTSNS